MCVYVWVCGWVGVHARACVYVCRRLDKINKYASIILGTVIMFKNLRIMLENRGPYESNREGLYSQCYIDTERRQAHNEQLNSIATY